MERIIREAAERLSRDLHQFDSGDLADVGKLLAALAALVYYVVKIRRGEASRVVRLFNRDIRFTSKSSMTLTLRVIRRT